MTARSPAEWREESLNISFILLLELQNFFTNLYVLMTTGRLDGKYNDNDTPIKFPRNSVSMNFYFKFSFEKKISFCLSV